mmetsp:Transcript_29760/g.56101  ORF Transcript_29760/g.56101 Transcript_29760/m.56101 type:complete len:116 (-) Transcript_29760:993-1340(-)
MYGVVLPPNHPGPVVFDITFADVRFPPAIPPILSAIQGVKVLNAIQSHVVPQNSQQARSLPDADKWVAPKHEEMQLIADEKMRIIRTRSTVCLDKERQITQLAIENMIASPSSRP